MKRALLGTLWIGAVAAGVAIVLQVSGLLARPAALLGRAIGPTPSDHVAFGNYLFVIALGFAAAWTMLEVTDAFRRAALLVLIMAELMGTAWVLHFVRISFSPLPAIVSLLAAAALAIAITATRSERQRRATARLFGGRLAQSAHDRLAQGAALDLSQPIARAASFVFCEIANEADLIDELSPPACAQLTGEFIDFASKSFLEEGGYLHAADGEGIRVLFGFPQESERHGLEAARAALAIRDRFRAVAAAKPESLGKIDLRTGISSGVVVATLRDDVPGGEIVIAGEPLEIARRLARANQIYGSEILLGPRTFAAAGKEILARPMDFLRNAQAHERLEVYELLALTEKATADEVAKRDRFWTGVVYFRERRWREAFDEFNRVRGEDDATDRPLQWYLGRLEPLCLMPATEPSPVVEPLAPIL
ncbi:MAG: adenylate/guanylate cyclase domain-containing protein [Chthoniobacterales bacterium]